MSFSASIAGGNGFGLGVIGSIGYDDGHFSASYGFGITGFGNYNGLGVSGFGYMAIAGGNNKKGWTFVSKEGRAYNSEEGNQDGTLVTGGKSKWIYDEEIQAKNNIFSKYPQYDKYLSFKVTYSDVKKAINAAYKSAKTDYNVLNSNCSHAVADGLAAIGLFGGSGLSPNARFNHMVFYNLKNKKEYSPQTNLWE